MSIVTKTGDDGTTGLFGGTRVRKNNPRLSAYGTVDELNALLGTVLAEKDLPETIRLQLLSIQHTLFTVGADLASPLVLPMQIPRITTEHTRVLEEWIEHWEKNAKPLQWFILPGGSRAGGLLHFARTVCRRAEREIVTLSKNTNINTEAVTYMNRLSDILFLLARATNAEQGHSEERVQYE